MSLPTPPGTSHRDKENRFHATGSRVAWSQHNQYHCPTNALPLQPTSASKDLPSKSILKRSSPLLTIPEDDKREITPEPSDPLADLKYLEYPISTVLAPDASLRDLIEAYSVLAARLRASVTGATDADASWPLFQPLRKHRSAVVDALVRDVGRATLNPGAAVTCPEELLEHEKVSLLPSPKNSPRKKKGMTAEQVKYARDLCTTSHAVMKLLGVMFTLPAVYRVFTDEQLGSVLTAVLAIPLANDLPTPNARKTCALSIWLLQVQRLPSEVLVPAKDRIAYALRRGIEGELGKEGKKGSTSDGLKAIHDLSVYQPATFVPAFAELLPSIFSNLLAQTLTLRAQACHALGGFVLGCTTLPSSYVHTRVSAEIASFLTTTALPSEASSTSPSKASQDPTIIRTLRTTLGATDPQHVAQGPVWALSVIACFIVLLGPALCTDIKLTRVISALLSLSMRHKKSSVRAIGCLVWRCVAWVYVRPPLQVHRESEVGDDGHDGMKEQVVVRESYWRIVKSVVDMGAGVSTVAALLGKDANDDEDLKRAMALIKVMIKRGGQTCGDAMEMVRHFVTCSTSDTEWDSNKLLPPALFSSSPGLLTAEYSSLVSVVRPIFDQCPQFDDVRSLTREELAKTWVFDGLIEIWKEGLSSLEITRELGASSEIIGIWEGLLKANVTELRDTGDDDGTSQFAVRAVKILAGILQDASLDLTVKASSSPSFLPTGPVTKMSPSLPLRSSRSSAALKLSTTRKLWTVTQTSIPHGLLKPASNMFLKVLMHNEDELVRETDSPDDARREWSLLCADVLAVCDIDELQAFWERKWIQKWAWTADVMGVVWKYFVQRWLVGGGNWEGAVALLAVPFADATTWDLSNEDFDSWDEFLSQTMDKALDYGIDSIAVLDHIACAVSQNHNPTTTSSARVADLLMSHLDIADARQLPNSIFEFVNDTLQSCYPPEPRNMVHSTWMIRSLTRVFHACPNELVLNLVETVQDGMCTWISDEYRVLSQEEYVYDILPVYEIALLSIKAISESIKSLGTVAPILESAFCGRPDKPAAISEAFVEFWQSTYSGAESLSEWSIAMQNCLQSASGSSQVAVEESSFDEGVQVWCDADISGDPQTGRNERSILQGNIDEEDLEYPDSDVEQEITSHRPFLFRFPMKRSPEEPPLTHFAPLLPANMVEAIDKAGFASPVVSDALEAPSTPRRTSASLVITSTPPRPHKPSTILPFPLFPPIASSLNPPVTPKRTPSNLLGNISATVSAKRRRLDNKENMSPPHLVVTSVVERIGMKSPGERGSPVLGKRGSLEQLPEEKVSKRGRIEVLMPLAQSVKADVESGPVEDAALILPSLLAGDFFELQAVTRADDYVGLSAPTRKRKRVVMDAVEVPTWREVKSMRQHSVLPLANARMTREWTQSAATSEGHASLNKRRRRRKRNASHAKNSPSSSPLDLEETINIAGSDDSIMQPLSPGRTPSNLSSDDDPHLGQVTPHHLVSPALRRVREEDYDPSSDESNMSSSPSRDLVARRRRRRQLL